ncbi:hypothetical protein HPB50_001964 [Hyalomma asiaticum]|uniref:Uncharacterized protein n=1 Tax=Hyalomma asiaticum TaxID=266040 RepID=A0ACB7RNV1_HYAAI|nr:hypothetical protein HPB50_001964 [Hyalomma asiaticum]
MRASFAARKFSWTYFYSGELKVDSVRQAFCTRTAAAKYLVPELTALCSKYVATHLTPEDVCPLLDNILTMGEHDTDEPARKLLRTQGNVILLSSSFKSCLECTVHYVLEHIGAVSEFSLIGAVYEWAQQQILLRQPDEGESLTVRKLMQPFIAKLRFLALTPSEFVSGVKTWGIFDEKEALALLSNIIDYECVAVPHGFCNIREERA